MSLWLKSQKTFGRNPKCDRDRIKNEKKNEKRIENKKVQIKKGKKVQIEKGNKSK